MGRTIGSAVVVGVGVATGVGEGVGDGFGVAEGDATRAGELFFTGTPFPHTSFLPDLKNVNFNPFTIEVIPAFLQTLPCLTAATAGVVAISVPAITRAQILLAVFMPKGKGEWWSDSMTQ